MSKDKLLTVLLWLSIGCVANMSIAVAETVQQKSTHKNVTNSHQKNKSMQNRKMSEKDITECTRLINKVVQTDNVLQNTMIAKAADNTKIAEQLKKPAEIQLFASDDPAAIAHLTGKTVNLAVSPVVKQIAKATKVMPITNISANSKPIAPVPTLKTVIKPIIPPNTQVFASDNPKDIALLTGKITASNAKTKPTTKLSVANTITTKITSSPAQPHIELFTPNTPNLNHLEGRSASLENIQKLSLSNKSVTAQQKTSKKSNPTMVTDTKTKTARSLN